MKKNEYCKKKLKHITPEEIKNFDDLLESFNLTSFQSRNLGKAYRIYKEMIQDKDCLILFGLAGAMVPGGMKKVIASLIKNKCIDVLVSTGANLYHDYYEALGYEHFIGSPYVDDDDLRRNKLDRFYDTYGDDVAMEEIDDIICEFSKKLEPRSYSTPEFFNLISKTIDDEDSILVNCRKAGVPIFCPTIHDSGWGIGLVKSYDSSSKNNGFVIDLIKDNYEIKSLVEEYPLSGAVYIGGGVPKNYIQQIYPMIRVCGGRREGHKYAIQITTDDEKWGGLSGCTFNEAKSWGKILKDSQTATVHIDATIGLSLIARALLENKKILKERKRKTHTNSCSVKKINTT